MEQDALKLSGKMKKGVDDPTLEEMKTFIVEKFKGLLDTDSKEEFEYPFLIAVHWFATHWHSGQGSELYGVLSTSVYNPNMQTFEGDKEDPSVEMIYDALEEHFAERT